MTTRPDYGEVTSYRPGDRVELHPGCDLWMMGAKYGTVTAMDYPASGGAVVLVRMDSRAVKRVQRCPLDRVRPA